MTFEESVAWTKTFQANMMEIYDFLSSLVPGVFSRNRDPPSSYPRSFFRPSEYNQPPAIGLVRSVESCNTCPGTDKSPERNVTKWPGGTPNTHSFLASKLTGPLNVILHVSSRVPVACGNKNPFLENGFDKVTYRVFVCVWFFSFYTSQ